MHKRLNSRLRSNVKTRRLMTLIIALILAYVICWTPWHLFHILTAFNVRIEFDTCNSFFHVYNWLIRHFFDKNLTCFLAWFGSIQRWTRFCTPSWAMASSSSFTRRWTRWSASCPTRSPLSKCGHGVARVLNRLQGFKTQNLMRLISLHSLQQLTINLSSRIGSFSAYALFKPLVQALCSSVYRRQISQSQIRVDRQILSKTVLSDHRQWTSTR